MRTLQEIMFPHLSDKRWCKVDLNFAARGKKRPESQVIKTLCDELKIDFPYGGWLEDRTSLWHDKYMMKENPPRPIHLGIDFWVPAKTAVNMPWSGETIHAYHDKDQDGGWGGRVTFYNHLGDFYFILGHLSIVTNLHTPGVNLNRGVTAGFIGKSSENGGWSPHLHLQVLTGDEFRRYKDPTEIDGYAAPSADLASRFPNPETLV